MAFLSRDSRMRVLKLRQWGLPRLWSPVTLRADLGSWWDLKQSCSSCYELFNGIFHIVYNQVNWVDSCLFGSLTLGLSFANNVFFRCLHEQWEPILDIYVPRSFQWCKEHHKPLNFDPCNYSLKFQECTGIPSPKMGVALGVWMFTPSHSLTLSYIPGSMWYDSWASSWPTPLWAFCLDSRAYFWPATLQPLCLGHELKARVATQVGSHIIKWHTRSNSCICRISSMSSE